MTIENTIQTLQREYAKAQASADALKSAIKTLGGSVDSVGKPAKRRKRGGWPKGKPRAKKTANDAPNDNGATATASGDAPSPIAKARAKRAGVSLAGAAS